MSKCECGREMHLCAYADTDQHGDIDVAPGTCSCGSGLPFEREYDAQGIYLCRVCPKCRKEKLSHYRPEILSGYNQSDVDEPIGAEE